MQEIQLTKLGELHLDLFRSWDGTEIKLDEPLTVTISYGDDEEYVVTDDVYGFIGFHELIWEALDDYTHNFMNGYGRKELLID